MLYLCSNSSEVWEADDGYSWATSFDSRDLGPDITRTSMTLHYTVNIDERNKGRNDNR